MTLFINNEIVAEVLTMQDTIDVLEKAYRDLAHGEAVCRPRVDIQIPTSDPQKAYQWGSMEGGSVGGYFAIRMKSDIIYETEYEGVRSQEKYCTAPGTFCGLIFVTDVETGTPLAFINDGVLQHMRVGADGGLPPMHNAGARHPRILQIFRLCHKRAKFIAKSPTFVNLNHFGILDD